MDTDCNCIHMPYSDGASFAGFVNKEIPVPGMPGKTITMRGIKNLDGVIDFMMAHGGDKATEFVVTGGSAGGLSTFLHADRFGAALKAGAKDIKTIRAAPVVGYFLDHDNFAHTGGGKPNTPGWSKPGAPTAQNYTLWMKYVYGMQVRRVITSGKNFHAAATDRRLELQLVVADVPCSLSFAQNMTFGADGGLTEACQTKHPTEPWLCFMSPRMQDVIETPFFMFNSKYDAWQLGNEFQSNWATKAEQAGVLQYGKDFMAQLAP